MKIAVWDTYVRKPNGPVMHFDILVPEHIQDKDKIYNFGKLYLSGKGLIDYSLTAHECQFCHIESASAEIQKHIGENGFYIIEMENCN
ncbi:MAG: DUF2024 family protein [Saprospiraceae bacterium]|nr:DUF2024 family protein [Saprospiraceae bacterium]